jgi:hypothetical protein
LIGKRFLKLNFFQVAENINNSLILIPIKGIKGQSEDLKKRDKAANDLFSKAVSKVRQPIESLFNWLIEKTDIQRASKVRSTKGLMVHVFGRLAQLIFISSLTLNSHNLLIFEFL